VSEYVVGLPERAARAFCEFLPLTLVELPSFLNQPSMNLGLIWHPRTEDDAGARYFRGLVVEACRETSPDPKTRTLDEPRQPRVVHARASRKTRASGSAP
jgi:hypothetical protein